MFLYFLLFLFFSVVVNFQGEMWALVSAGGIIYWNNSSGKAIW